MWITRAESVGRRETLRDRRGWMGVPAARVGSASSRDRCESPGVRGLKQDEDDE
jgi:hypothetical protein